MKKVIFISYAWTSDSHRAWVNLLASHLHLIGYSILLDEKVDYGESLSGFMQKISETAHVLLIVDENYVARANTMPESGVGIENDWISRVYHKKESNWLSVLFVDNPEFKLPNWLKEINPKGFNFNAKTESGEFPGAIQINDLWRWAEGLPADTDFQVSIPELRARAARIERIDRLRDPGNYANPATTGKITFRYNEHQCYTVGIDEYQFKIKFSTCGHDSVYVYNDQLHAVGLITSASFTLDNIGSFITPGRTVTPTVGQSVVLMNKNGLLCLITILDVQREINSSDYTPSHVVFSYQIIHPYGTKGC